MSRSRATAIGFTAILMWALLALLTVGSAPVPPFLLSVICFGIGGGLALIWVLAGRGPGVFRGIPVSAYVFGTAGLFGYHFLYFSALRIAPAAEAGLIAYLWPLLIVLLSGLLPGEKLRAGHLIGAALAFAGAAIILLPDEAGLAAEALPGYGLAFLCAITWAIYSVGSRRFGMVPTEVVTIYCLATAVLSLIAHLGFEETVWPESTTGWISIVALGIGPVGAAFFTWDIGMKKGDIQFLGVASYAAPLLSTLALILAGIAAATPVIVAAAVLIAAGAAIAARAGRSSIGKGG
ncbi:MAG: DMT family transporter [Pseudorhodobacter sp.]